jgi:hypothetical protein
MMCIVNHGAREFTSEGRGACYALRIMRKAYVALVVLALVLPAHARNRNPIRVEGQIREITYGYAGVTVRLHRDRYPIFLGDTARVRWLDGRKAAANELLKGDSIRVEGDLDANVIHAERVTILQRDEHR